MNLLLVLLLHKNFDDLEVITKDKIAFMTVSFTF